MELKDKVALITGAAKRVGQTLALGLADQGCHIIIHYGQSEAEAENTANQIRAKGVKAWCIQANLADEDAVQALIPQSLALAKQLDILVNNASIFMPEGFLEADSSRWDETMMINLKAPFLLSQAFAKAQKPDQIGKIINLLDIGSERPKNHHFSYTISKVALRGLNQAMAHALAAQNIQVNGLALGYLLPDVNDPDEASFQKMAKRNPSKRLGSPEDVLGAMLYFLREADFVTGEVINIDGGKHLV